MVQDEDDIERLSRKQAHFKMSLIDIQVSNCELERAVSFIDEDFQFIVEGSMRTKYDERSLDSRKNPFVRHDKSRCLQD